MTEKPYECNLEQCDGRGFFSLEEKSLHTRRKHSQMIIDPSDKERVAGYTRQITIGGSSKDDD